MVLLSEVMLHQTQVARVEAAWPDFIRKFPTPETMVAAGPGSVIAAWGRLGYPRRARRLYDAACIIATSGWPADLTCLPGVGRYTAGAIAAQALGVDVPAVDVNIRRVTERIAGRPLTMSEAEASLLAIGEGLISRDRLLAVMDIGATLCTRNAPLCDECPFSSLCASRQAITRGETPPDIRRPSRQAAYIGSFRQRRGEVLATLRLGTALAADLDQEALHSLVTDGLAAITGNTASLPTRQAFVEEHKAVPSARG